MASVAVEPARIARVRPARMIATSSAITAYTGTGGPSVESAWGNVHRDQLIIVDATTQARLGELRSGQIDKPRWKLNDVGDMSFRVPADDPTLLDCLVDPATVDLGKGKLKLLGREAQWWRNGQLRWAGPVVSAEVDASGGQVNFRAFDLGWYFGRRVMGEAERKDLLNNQGQFESPGLPGWTASGTTATRDLLVKARGGSSVKLSGVGAITNTFTFPAQSVGQDLTVRVTGVVRLPSGLPADTAVLSVNAFRGGVEVRPGNWTTAKTRTDTPSDTWERFDAYCIMEPGYAHQIQVTLWSTTAGPVWFDDVRSLRNDTTGIAAPGADLVEHGLALVDHSQSVSRGKAPFGAPFGREWLSLTGTIEVMGVRHLEHTSVLDLLDQYASRDDGFDWWPDPQTRTVLFAARRGQDQTEFAVDNWTTRGGGWTQDETQRASAVIVLGDGSAVERAEGGYSNGSRTDGMILDRVIRPVNGTKLIELDPLARSEWESASRAPSQLAAVRVPGEWWDDLSPGDTLPVSLSAGVLVPDTYGSTMRVSEITYDLVDDVLELV